MLEKFVSISMLQLNLSRTLRESTEEGSTYYISNRGKVTHKLVPIEKWFDNGSTSTAIEAGGTSNEEPC